MELFRCPSCNHWRCEECADNSAALLSCCKCGEKALAKDWYQGHRKRGKPQDNPPRLGTGKPSDASKQLATQIIEFLKRYGLPIRSMCRLLCISHWALYQARAGIRNLQWRKEPQIRRFMQDMRAGNVWLRRKITGPRNRWRWDLQYLNP